MTFAFASALVAMLPMFGGMAYAQPNPYREVAGWAKAPEGRPWGAMASVDVDRDGNIWVLERCGANSCIDSRLGPVLKFDPSGKLLTSFGAGLFAFPQPKGAQIREKLGRSSASFRRKRSCPGTIQWIGAIS
jgi:hypothetical protein